MTNFKKTIRIGAIPTYNGIGRYMSVFCKIKFIDGKLSITGVEGPLPSGNCLGGCGQIVMSLKDEKDLQWIFADGWNADTLAHFLAIWEEWHLNDMVAGSPRQEAFLKANDTQGDYTSQLTALEGAGLSPDAEYNHNGKPYKYGSAWLRKEVPQEAIDFLRALPDTDKAPAWV